MITPRMTSAATLRIVCETSVPISTGKVSRMRPTRRATTIALAGSPRRAGSVADISTPTIVPDVMSRRRTGRLGSAARTIAYQDPARTNIEAIISPSAISTQPGFERTKLSATWSRPIRLAASAVRPIASRPAVHIATRRTKTPVPPAGAGSIDGSRSGGRRAPPAAGASPARLTSRSAVPSGCGASIASA